MAKKTEETKAENIEGVITEETKSETVEEVKAEEAAAKKTVCPNCKGKKVLRSENFPCPYECEVCGGTGEVDG